MAATKTDKSRLFKGVFIGVQVDLTSKPVFEDIVDILEEKGVEDASTVAVGSLVKLWCYIQQHGDAGKIQCSLQKLCRRTKIRRDVGELIVDSEWFNQADGLIEIVDWQKKFFDGSADRLAVEREQNRKRQQNFRDTHHKEDENVTERNGNVTRYETLRNGSVTPIEVDRYIEEEEYKEVEVDRDGTATKLDLFLKRLGKAGLHVPKAPFWLLEAMSNGKGDVYLAAAEQLQYTKYMEMEKPTTIDNFKVKSFGWVQRLANGEFSKGGPAPQAATVDPSKVKRTVPWCGGKRLTRAEEDAAKTHPDTKHLWEHYQSRLKRDLDRDTHRGDTPSADAPISQAIPIPTLKNADENFDTEGAKERELAKLAASLKTEVPSS